jgi:hypothetical protein
VSWAANGLVNAVGIALREFELGFGAFVGPALWGFVLKQTGNQMVGTAIRGTLGILAAPLPLLASKHLVSAEPARAVPAPS